MKKLILLFLLFTTFVTMRTILMDQNLRSLQIYSDEQGLHHVYFTEPRAGETLVCLGEEIFRNGEKIFDNYKEND